MKTKRIGIYAGIVFFVSIIIIGIIFINTRKKPVYNEIDQAIIDLYESESFGSLNTVPYGVLDAYNGNVNAPEYVEHNGKRYYLNEFLVEGKYIGNELYKDESSGMIVYSVKHMTSDLALAIKDTKNENYYPYITEEYNMNSVGNMEEFLQETGFYETSKNIVVCMSSVQENKYDIYYQLNDEDMVEQVMSLMEEVSKNANKIDRYSEKYSGLSIVFDMDHIEKRVTIMFYENGNIAFDCGVNGRFVFNTGKEGIEFATELIEYLRANCSGRIFE